jgi:hypothetical protein
MDTPSYFGWNGEVLRLGCSKSRAGSPPADTHRQKNIAEQAPHKSTDGDMVTLITTVQQIMTCLQTADTEEDRFAPLCERFMDWLCGNKGHNQPYSIVHRS